jgi:hypothetical protein
MRLRATAAAKDLLRRISTLVQLTGGHPRSVQSLMLNLTDFKFRDPISTDPMWGADVVDALDKWLTLEYEDLKTEIMRETAYPGDEVLYVVDLNVLAVDVAKEFFFPQSGEARRMHFQFMRACELGVCAFHSSSVSNPLFGHAYLPFRVLQDISGFRIDPGPCRHACSGGNSGQGLRSAATQRALRQGCHRRWQDV